MNNASGPCASPQNCHFRASLIKLDPPSTALDSKGGRDLRLDYRVLHNCHPKFDDIIKGGSWLSPIRTSTTFRANEMDYINNLKLVLSARSAIASSARRKTASV
jgi:hypothetical protein